MSPLLLVTFLLVALGGTAVVATTTPKQQAVVLSLYGLLQALLFFLLQAPDVALAALAVSSVALPLMLLATLAKVREEEE